MPPRKTISLLTFAPLPLFVVAQQSTPADTRATQFANDLLSKMSTAEEVGQFEQAPGAKSDEGTS